MHSLRRGRHVGTLRHSEASVGKQRARVVAVKLVLCGRRHCDVALHAPWASALKIFAAVFLSKLAYASAVDVFKFEDKVELFLTQSFRHVDCAVGVAHRYNFGAKFKQLLCRVGSHVAGAGDGNLLALDVDAASGEHIEKKVDIAVASGFRAYQRASEFKAFAGKRAGVLARHLLVHAIHVAHFASANADVAGRHVAVGAKVAPQFSHKCLTEAHHLHV